MNFNFYAAIFFAIKFIPHKFYWPIHIIQNEFQFIRSFCIKMSTLSYFSIFLYFLINIPISTAQTSSLCPKGQICTDAKSISLIVANPYPSVHMNRYNLIREFYPAFRILANCYFAIVNAFFALYNSFNPIEFVPSSKNDDFLSKYSIQQTRNMIRLRHVKCLDLLNELIGRTNSIYKMTNSLAFNNYRRERKMAEEMDEKLSKMSDEEIDKLIIEKPLFGIPFTTMANIENEGMVVNACNGNVDKTLAQKDATVVQRVKNAGAILLGITTMPNLGLGWSSDDSACGIVSNPHDIRRICGGSSSGEGSIIAAGGSIFGIGNDFGTSMLISAHMCGIMALKPTNFPNHLIPSDGIRQTPLDGQMVTNGPLFRQALDLPILLSVMAKKSIEEFTKPIDFGKNFKLFYIEEIDILVGESLHSNQRNSIREVRTYFEMKYNLTVQKVNFPLMNRLFEFWGLSFWGKSIPKIYPDLFNEFLGIFWSNSGTKNETFHSLELNILKNFVLPRDEKEKEFVSSKLDKLRRQVTELLAKNGALLSPIWPTPPPFHHMGSFIPFNFYYTQFGIYSECRHWQCQWAKMSRRICQKESNLWPLHLMKHCWSQLPSKLRTILGDGLSRAENMMNK